MASEAPPAVAACHTISVLTSRQTEFVDLTDRLHVIARHAGPGAGVLHVQTRHTTTGLLINEAEPLLLDDLAARLARWAPCDVPYAHDDLSRRTVNVGPDERPNGFAHCRAALLRSSETVLLHEGRLLLGRWQRVLLAEFDGPQRREVVVLVVPAR